MEVPRLGCGHQVAVPTLLLTGAGAKSSALLRARRQAILSASSCCLSRVPCVHVYQSPSFIVAISTMPGAPFPLLGNLLGFVTPPNAATRTAWASYLDQQRRLAYDTIGPDWPLFNRHVEYHNNRVWDALHKAVVTHQHQWAFSDPSQGELDIATAFRHHVAKTLGKHDSMLDSLRCRLADRRACEKATRDMEKEFLEMPISIHSLTRCPCVLIHAHIQALFSPTIKRMFAPVYAVVPSGKTFFSVDVLKAAWSEGRNGMYQVPTTTSPSTRSSVVKSKPGIRCWCGCEGPAWCAYATALIEYNNRLFEREDARAQARAHEEADASRKRARSPCPAAEEVDVLSFDNLHLEDIDDFPMDDEMSPTWESSLNAPHPVIDWEAVFVEPEMKRRRRVSPEAADGVDVWSDADALRCADPDAFLSIPEAGVGA